MEKLLAPIREALYESVTKVGASDNYSGPGGIPSRALFLLDEGSGRDFVFAMAADPSTDSLIVDVMQRGSSSNG
jgi:hypothetical protein